LALLESIQITLSDLPKHLYRESTNRSVGLFGVSIFKKWENKQQLWIASIFFNFKLKIIFFRKTIPGILKCVLVQFTK